MHKIEIYHKKRGPNPQVPGHWPDGRPNEAVVIDVWLCGIYMMVT